MARKKTHGEFIAEVKALVEDEYSVISQYLGSNKKITFLHVKCGTRYEARSIGFLQGNRCPKCARIGTHNKTTTQFKEDVYHLVGDEYTVLGEYISTLDKILLKHNVCNYEYMVMPKTFLRGYRCSKCANAPTKTTHSFKDEVFKIEGNEYEVLGEYVNSRTKLLMRHNTCSTDYEVSPNHFLSGKRCPKCRLSKGEKKIRDSLHELEILYVPEYTFKDCEDIGRLRFDIATFKGDKIVALIEFDGAQHYRPVKRFGGEATFKVIQRRDAIKTQYCADNGIPLIRIPYWDYDNIDAILTEKLLPLLNNADKHNAS